MQKMRVGYLTSLMAFSLLFSGCSTKDEQFCRCMSLGQELNEASSKALAGDLTSGQAQKVRNLIQRQKKECSQYHQLNGPELKELQSGCTE